MSEEMKNVLYVRMLDGFSVKYNGVELIDQRQLRSQFCRLMELILFFHETGVNREVLKEALFEDREIEDVQHAIRNIVFEAAQMHANDRNRQTIGTEVSFGSDKPILLSFGDYQIMLAGRIDRVDQIGIEYEIIDYKTGRPFSFRRDIKSKLQYYLYSRHEFLW